MYIYIIYYILFILIHTYSWPFPRWSGGFCPAWIPHESRGPSPSKLKPKHGMRMAPPMTLPKSSNCLRI